MSRRNANPDGSRTAKISISPQRFKDSTGKWVEYDLSIVNRTDGTLGARAAPQAAKLNKKADGNVATVETTAGPVTLRHPNVSPAPVVLDKHEAKYAGALSAGRDLKIALTPDGFEESVILPDAKAPASYTDELVLPAGVTVRETEQGVELFDKAGKGIASFGGGFAYDAEFPQGAVPTPVSVRLVSQKANVASLEVSIADPTWLSAPGRSFPVTIDPTFAQFGTAPGSGGIATHVIAGTPADSRPANIAYYGGISLGAGLYNQGNKIRTLLRFDVSSIPADAVVTYAQLAMFNTYTGFSYSCIGKTVDAYALAGPFSAATTWNTQPAVSGAPVPSPEFAHQPWPNGGGNYCPETWVGLPVTPIVQGWRNGANHGVELRGNEGDMGSFQHFFSSHTGQYQPYLQLNWDRVPNPPTNVVATANPDGSATVNWTLATVPPNSSAVDWYVVLALNPADLSYAGDYAVLCATCTTATLTNLAPSRTYVLGVYPHNGAGYGFAPSNQIITTPATLTTPLAVGPDHSLSVRSDQSVFAWGRNTTGQLGDNTTTDNPGGATVANLGGVKSVAAGGGHSMALKGDGTVWAWGRNQSGELGDEDIGVDKLTPAQVVLPVSVSAIAAGCDHSLALGSDGSVWAFGSNSLGQSGIPTVNSKTQLAAHVLGVSSVKAIAAGCRFSLALDTSGQVWAWGANASGQLGDGTTTSRFLPARITALSGVTAIATGTDHALAVKADGSVQAWGYNSTGQLGDGGTVTGLSPVSVRSLTGVTRVAAGTGHSAAVTSSGAVWAWGANDHHQLGNINTANSSTPVQVRKDNAGSPLTGMSSTIAAGGSHSIGVSTQLVLFEWGEHSGTGTDCIIATPIPAPGTSAITDVFPPLPITRPKPDCDNAVAGVPSFYALDGLDRAHGVVVHLTYKNLWQGDVWDAPPLPAGFVSSGTPYFHVKAHLLAKVLGGPGTVRENFVTMYAHANSPVMRDLELRVRDALKNCGEVDYSVVPHYVGTDLLPDYIQIDAVGTVRSTIVIHSAVPNVP